MTGAIGAYEGSEFNESAINDVSWSEDLHELEDKIVDKIDEPVGQPTINNEEGGSDDNSGMDRKSDEETEDDERDNSVG